MVKFISGIAKDSNLSKWADYAKGNSYGHNKAQARAQLLRRSGDDEKWSDDWQQPQKRQEGKGWNISNDCAAGNTYQRRRH